jgi:high frequency lysogenization protein
MNAIMAVTQIVTRVKITNDAEEYQCLSPGMLPMNRPLSERVIALAGIFQAASLTQHFARQGRGDPAAFTASVESILNIEAVSTEEVYGGVEGVFLGLKLLHDKLSGATDAKDLELARYVIAMIQLERTLAKRPDVLDTIRHGIQAAQSQTSLIEADELDGVERPNLIEKLAELYTQTLSTLSPRIMINGEPGYLANPRIAASIRAVLLAGIRSVVLWRQLGGNRWQLLLSRKKIAAEAKKQLDASSAQQTIH